MKKGDVKVWRAVYTKPRSEKKIAERLSRQGLDVYCPLQTTLNQWSDRKKKVSEPIFPSYLFLRISDVEYDLVLQDPGVSSFVYWLGKPALIRDEEIEEIRAFLNNYQDFNITLISYEKGDNVEIKAGPLSGQTGTVTRLRNGKASLLIKSLGLLVKVEVNTVVLEKSNRKS